MKIRTNDEVVVISGKEKGKTGKVMRVDRERSKVYVEGLNMVKRHQRANPARQNAPVGVIERFGYSSAMQAPRLLKITLNMGVGEAKQDSKMLDTAQGQLATIAGQKPNVRRARKSVAAFKLREGMPVGLTVTLRGVRAYEFLDRLVSIAIPRIRDFRGLNPRSFDGRGNYSMGVREQIIFPEIDYDNVDQVRGLDVTMTTSAQTDAEAFALLDALGMPFARDTRPEGFESLNTELATA